MHVEGYLKIYRDHSVILSLRSAFNLRFTFIYLFANLGLLFLLLPGHCEFLKDNSAKNKYNGGGKIVHENVGRDDIRQKSEREWQKNL